MIPKHKPGASSRALPDGQEVVLAPQHDRVIMLNPLGSVVWGFCDGNRDLGAIAAEIQNQFADVDPEQVRRDVTSLVDELVDLGVVESIRAE